jgi:hypothetical protein
VVTLNYSNNISVGGFRYFSLVAILPAYHLWLECTEHSGSAFKVLGWTLPLMAAQVVIFVFSILCRNSGAALIGAFFVGSAATAWRYRREPGSIARAWTKAASAALVAGAFIGILALFTSKTYLSEGRFTEIIWHRVFLSLGVSPEWPFGDLREIYDCAPIISEGLVGGAPDRNGHCVFVVYARKHNIPPDVFTTMTYGSVYDAVLREAFFHILRLYPYQVLKTFLYYKPLLILYSIKQSFHFRIAETPFPLTWLFFVAFINVIMFATIVPSSPRFGAQIIGATASFAAFNSITYLVVWAMPHTAADLLFFCLFVIGFGAMIATAKFREILDLAFVSPQRTVT